MRQILIAGDSTVTDRKSSGTYDCGLCYTGWGQMLPLHLGAGMIVRNFAVGGLTTETFRTEGHYAALCDVLQPDDIVLIQFGHNDQKLPHLQAEGQYRENLLQYITDIREKRAVPILVTSLARNSWRGDTGLYNDMLADYAETVMKLGNDVNVTVLDLHKVSVEWICREGREAVKPYFYPGDFTHTNDYGAYHIAGFVAVLLREKLGDITANPAWYAPQPSKIPPELNERPNECMTRREALWLCMKMFSYFTINESTKSGNDEGVIAAAQNGFLTFQDDLDKPITETALLAVLRLAASGRETLTVSIFQTQNASDCCVTRQQALAIVKEYETQMGVQCITKAPDMAGS